MPRAWDSSDEARAFVILYGFRDELIAIARAQIALQRQQLHLKEEQEKIEMDRLNEVINEGDYIRLCRNMVTNWNTYKEEIVDLSHQAPRWEDNMHTMLDMFARRGIDYNTPRFVRQTSTLQRLNSIIQSNIDKGCT